MGAYINHHLLKKEASPRGLRDTMISGYSDKPLGIGLIFCPFSRMAVLCSPPRLVTLLGRNFGPANCIRQSYVSCKPARTSAWMGEGLMAIPSARHKSRIRKMLTKHFLLFYRFSASFFISSFVGYISNINWMYFFSFVIFAFDSMSKGFCSTCMIAKI